MGKIRVRRGGEVPEVRVGPPYKYPFRDMTVGEWFEAEASYETLYSCAKTYVRRYAPEKKFLIKRVAENKCRVYREV